MNLFELYVKIGAEDKASPAMKNVQKNSETLTNKIKVMSAQFESAQKNVDELTKKFNESVQKTGATSKETKELAKKLTDAEKEAEKAKKALDDYNSELEETEEKAENAGNSLSKFSNKLGNGLKTAAKIGAAAVGVAATGIVALTKQSVDAYSEYEQLAGGAAKIFDQMNQTKILTDAQNAYKDLGLSASQYLAVMNDVGATFASTMGDEKGYNTARQGLQAISDYASGTGKNVDLLSEKFMMITRSSASYQSIADQFSGILPATSAAFLEQAQAAGILEDKYKKITEVPIDEYQEAVAKMLEKGVESLGLAGNTAAEAENTITGSLSAAKASWENLIVGFSDANADVDILLDNFIESVVIAVDNIVPVVSRAFPSILNAGKEIIKNLLDGIINSQNDVSEGATETIRTIVDVIGEMLPLVLQAGVKIIGQLLMGAIQSIPSLLVLGVHILEAVQSAVWTASNGLAQVGFYIVEGIQKGVSNAWGNFLSWFMNLFNLLIEDVKGILGIASPSKVFKEIGKFTAEGFGIGFDDEFSNVKQDIEKALDFNDVSVGINSSIRSIGSGKSAMYHGGTSFGDINITIQGARYTDEQSLAEAVAIKIQGIVDRKAAVYA